MLLLLEMKETETNLCLYYNKVNVMEKFSDSVESQPLSAREGVEGEDLEKTKDQS